MIMARDPYLNIFSSYQRGDHASEIDRTKRYEDNVTWAFIITFSKLDENQQERFISGLTPKSSKGKIILDLQNFDGQIDTVHKKVHKILLAISRSDQQFSGITKNSFTGNVSDELKKLAQAFSTEKGIKKLKKNKQ